MSVCIHNWCRRMKVVDNLKCFFSIPVHPFDLFLTYDSERRQISNLYDLFPTISVKHWH